MKSFTRSKLPPTLDDALRREAAEARAPGSPERIARVQALLREAPRPELPSERPLRLRPVLVLAAAAVLVLAFLPLLSRRGGAPEHGESPTVASVVPPVAPGRTGILPRLALPVPTTALDDPLRREMQSLLQDTTGMARTLLGALPRGPRGS